MIHAETRTTAVEIDAPTVRTFSPPWLSREVTTPAEVPRAMRRIDSTTVRLVDALAPRDTQTEVDLILEVDPCTAEIGEEWLLPEELLTALSASDGEESPEARAVTAKLLCDAEERAADGRFSEARDLLELACMLSPHNDVVRARMSSLVARFPTAKRRGDETIQVGFD